MRDVELALVGEEFRPLEHEDAGAAQLAYAARAAEAAQRLGWSRFG